MTLRTDAAMGQKRYSAVDESAGPFRFWKTPLPMLPSGHRFFLLLGLARFFFGAGAGEGRQDAVEFELFGINVHVHTGGGDRQLERPKDGLHDEATILRQLPVAMKVQSHEAK